MDRRTLITAVGASALAAAMPVRRALEALDGLVHADDPYGPLGPADALGVRVPAGFATTLIGRSGEAVAGTGYVWHANPDGAACFASADGHILVSNSEVGGGGGGVGAVRFDAAGAIVGASSILSGTSRNCAGGATPWGTWLSCEEAGSTGRVFECDPAGGPAIHRPALGAFNHEAAAVDPWLGHVYLTEDDPAGRLYRFAPAAPRDLSSGTLEAAEVAGGVLRWHPASVHGPDRSPDTTGFDGGEGIVIEHRTLYFATKGDRRVWEVSLETGEIGVLHDAVARPDTALSHVDNLALHPQTHHLFVAEDGGNMELCVIVVGDGAPSIHPVVQFVGHDGSEVTGPAFSPDGRRLYVTSQRGTDGRGMTVCVTGPWVEYLRSIDGPATVGRPAIRLPS